MAVVQALCPSIAMEKHFCVGYGPATPWQVVALGMDTGSVCIMGTADTNPGASSESVAVVGTYLYACDVHVWRVPLAGGALETLDVGCDQIIAYGQQFLVVHDPSDSTIARFESVEALEAWTPAEVVTLGLEGRAYAVQGDTLWTCEQSPEVLSSFSLPSWSPSGTVTAAKDLSLAVAQGLDVTDDGLVLLHTAFGFFVLDATTGETVRQVTIAGPRKHPMDGLHCWTNPDEARDQQR